MSKETFKEAYGKAKVWKEMEDAIKDNLIQTEIQELVKAMELVKATTGLDMRQGFTFGLLKHYAKRRQYHIDEGAYYATITAFSEDEALKIYKKNNPKRIPNVEISIACMG